MKKSLLCCSVLSASLLLTLSSCSTSTSKPATPAAETTPAKHGKKGHRHKSATPETTTAVKPYPLQTCLVSGDKLDPKDEVTYVYKGQEYKFCCEKCLASFKKNPAKYTGKLSA